MALSIEEVRRIAHLARLRLSPEEEAEFAVQLSRIVDYIDQLKDLPTASPEGETTAVGEAEDVPGDSLPRDAVLRNAPAVLDGFVLAPQVKAPNDG